MLSVSANLNRNYTHKYLLNISGTYNNIYKCVHNILYNHLFGKGFINKFCLFIHALQLTNLSATITLKRQKCTTFSYLL